MGALAASPARAEQNDGDDGGSAYDWGDEDDARTLEKSWYGWQTLMIDGISLFGLGASIATGSDVTAAPAALAFIWGPPLVHWAHGRGGAGFGSLAIRLGGTLIVGVGALTAYSECPLFSDSDCSSSAGTGIAVAGAVVALFAVPVDAAFAFDEVDPRDRTARARVWLSPVVTGRQPVAGLSVGLSTY